MAPGRRSTAPPTTTRRPAHPPRTPRRSPDVLPWSAGGRVVFSVPAPFPAPSTAYADVRSAAGSRFTGGQAHSTLRTVEDGVVVLEEGIPQDQEVRRQALGVHEVGDAENGPVSASRKLHVVGGLKGYAAHQTGRCMSACLSYHLHPSSRGEAGRAMRRGGVNRAGTHGTHVSLAPVAKSPLPASRILHIFLRHSAQDPGTIRQGQPQHALPPTRVTLSPLQ